MLKILDDLKAETARRRSICGACENRILRKIPYTGVEFYACNLCGCSINNMTAIPGNHCKADKWRQP